MTTEVERRFLVPTDVEVSASSSERQLMQGYLAVDGSVSVRLRRSDDTWVLCVKGGHGLIRTEVERDVSDAEADAMWPLTEGRRISKVRRRIGLAGGLTAELDEFGDELAGLRIVEVEFDSAHDAERFEPPSWFGTEVTDDSRWSNSNLAQFGLPT